jgi:hypothetical protein
MEPDSDDWDDTVDAPEAAAMLYGALRLVTRGMALTSRKPLDDAREPSLVVMVNGRAATVEEADAALKSGGRPLKIACWEEP